MTPGPSRECDITFFVKGRPKSARQSRDSTVAARRVQSVTVPSSRVSRECRSPGLRSPPFRNARFQEAVQYLPNGSLNFLRFNGVVCSNTLFSNTSALTNSLLFMANSTRKGSRTPRLVEHFWAPILGASCSNKLFVGTLRPSHNWRKPNSLFIS